MDRHASNNEPGAPSLMLALLEGPRMLSEAGASAKRARRKNGAAEGSEAR